MKIAYHNYDKEFSSSAREFQGLLRLTDPNPVGFLPVAAQPATVSGVVSLRELQS